ncbi:MAG: hypothetical protein R6V10_10620 [bacterium]
MKKFVWTLAGAALVLSFAGCDLADKAADKAKEKAMEEVAKQSGEDVEIDHDEGKIKVKSKEGEDEKTYEKGEAKEGKGLPSSDLVEGKDIKDVPRFPDAVKISAFSSNKEIMNKYVADAAMDEVGKFYKTELPENGWNKKGEMQKGEELRMVFQKEGRSLGITVEPASQSRYKGNVTFEVVASE